MITAGIRKMNRVRDDSMTDKKKISMIDKKRTTLKYKRFAAICVLLALVLGTCLPETPGFAAVQNSAKRVIYVGQKCKFPFTASVKLNYSSSNSRVAKVSSNGVIKGLKKGKAVITASCGASSAICNVTVKSASVSKNAKKVLKLVNKERKKRGLSKLKLDSKLCQVAQIRAKETVKLFSHTRPGGGNYVDIIKNKRIFCRISGENIAAGQSTAKEVMNAWMKSPGHKANIVKKEYKRIGIGFIANNKKYSYYWVQIFAG